MNLQNYNLNLSQTATPSKKKNKRKELRLFLTNISMFLLNEEKLKNLLWSVKSVNYRRAKNTLEIGINATDKLGTVLSKMRSLRKPLAEYLYEQRITSQIAKITFFVDKEDEVVEQIYSLIENLQTQSQEQSQKE
jgi:hypothetical protein